MNKVNVIVTNNNPKEIKVKIKYDEKFDLMRVDVKLKVKSKKVKR